LVVNPEVSFQLIPRWQTVKEIVSGELIFKLFLQPNIYSRFIHRQTTS